MRRIFFVITSIIVAAIVLISVFAFSAIPSARPQSSPSGLVYSIYNAASRHDAKAMVNCTVLKFPTNQSYYDFDIQFLKNETGFNNFTFKVDDVTVIPKEKLDSIIRTVVEAEIKTMNVSAGVSVVVTDYCKVAFNATRTTIATSYTRVISQWDYCFEIDGLWYFRFWDMVDYEPY